MSNIPRRETQALREPVATGPFTLALLQSVDPSSDLGPGTGTTASCHSALLGNRLAELPHACCA